MENSIPVLIPFSQPPAEPSDNSASLSLGNGDKANPVNKSILALFEDYDISSVAF